MGGVCVQLGDERWPNAAVLCFSWRISAAALLDPAQFARESES